MKKVCLSAPRIIRYAPVRLSIDGRSLGMCQETLNNSPAALVAYDAGLKVIEALVGSNVTTEKENLKAFLAQRELWRWTERLLRRRNVLAARHL